MPCTTDKVRTVQSNKKYNDAGKRKIHNVAAADASDSEEESATDSDYDLTLHMVSAVNTEPVKALKTGRTASLIMAVNG